MKTTMKKIAAYLLAVLLVFQMMPAFAATYSGTITLSDTTIREALEIKTENDNTIIPVGTQIQLTVSDDYANPKWSSSNEDIATVDKKSGLVEAKAAGTVTITVKAEGYQDTITFRVTESNGSQTASTSQSKDEKIIIVIKGDKSKVEYNGQEQVNTYTVSSNSELFDEAKLTKNEGNLGKGTNCGVYQDNLQASDFTYEGGDAEFVISNGWIQIKPKEITIKADDVTIMEGEEDPELTATVTGICGEDQVSYFLIRQQGSIAGTYSIDVHGEEKQGNYKITYESGVMTVTEKEAEPLEPLSVSIVCLHPAGEPVEYGMGITLEATVTGAEAGEYTIQWQYSTDFQNWVDIPGANSLRYTFTANGETVTYSWRAVADRIQ